MKNKKYTQLASIFLLLIYFMGLVPSMLIHHHEENRIPFEQATQCEKAIYYGDVIGACHHHQHVTKELPSCWICDHHLLSHQLFFHHADEFHAQLYSFKNYFFYYTKIYPTPLHHFFNKGPPLA